MAKELFVFCTYVPWMWKSIDKWLHQNRCVIKSQAINYEEGSNSNAKVRFSMILCNERENFIRYLQARSNFTPIRLWKNEQNGRRRRWADFSCWRELESWCHREPLKSKVEHQLGFERTKFGQFLLQPFKSMPTGWDRIKFNSFKA